MNNYNKTKYLVLVLALILIISNSLKAQWMIMNAETDSLVNVGIKYIYNVRFAEAEKTAKQIQNKYPFNQSGYFLEAVSYWWKILMYVDSREYDKPFLKSIDKVINKCDEVLENTPSEIGALFFKGAALGYRGRFYSQREEWIKAALDGHQAYKILEKALSIAPNNRDMLFGIGYYNYFSIVLPEKYPLLKPLMAFAPVGNKKLGLLQVKASANSARYSSLEAKIVLMQIYYTFEKNTSEALKIANELFSQFPDNPYFHRYIGRCCVSLGQFSQFEQIWYDILKKCRNKKVGYDDRTAREAMYYYGTALYYKNEYDRALKYFLASSRMSNKFDKEVTGFVIQSSLKIGKIYDMQNKRSKAIEYYKKVASWEDNYGSKQEAKRYLKKPYGQY